MIKTIRTSFNDFLRDLNEITLNYKDKSIIELDQTIDNILELEKEAEQFLKESLLKEDDDLSKKKLNIDYINFRKKTYDMAIHVQKVKTLKFETKEELEDAVKELQNKVSLNNRLIQEGLRRKKISNDSIKALEDDIKSLVKEMNSVPLTNIDVINKIKEEINHKKDKIEENKHQINIYNRIMFRIKSDQNRQEEKLTEAAEALKKYKKENDDIKNESILNEQDEAKGENVNENNDVEVSDNILKTDNEQIEDKEPKPETPDMIKIPFEDLDEKNKEFCKVTLIIPVFNENGTVKTKVWKEVKAEKGTPLKLNENPEFPDEWLFNGWVDKDNELYDNNKPVTRDIILRGDLLRLIKVTFHYGKKMDQKSTFYIKKGESLDEKNLAIVKNNANESASFTKVLSSWQKRSDNGQKNFDISTKLLKDTDLYSTYRFDWKRVASVALGFALGVSSSVIDSRKGRGVSALGMAIASETINKLYSFALRNSENTYESYNPNFKGLKRATNKVKEFFLDSENIKNIKSFLDTCTYTSLGVGISTINR